VVPATWKAEVRIQVKGWLRKKRETLSENCKSRKTGTVAQVVESLPTKLQALCSVPSAQKTSKPPKPRNTFYLKMSKVEVTKNLFHFQPYSLTKKVY
jgi:hypothetical protein